MAGKVWKGPKRTMPSERSLNSGPADMRSACLSISKCTTDLRLMAHQVTGRPEIRIWPQGQHISSKTSPAKSLQSWRRWAQKASLLYS